MEPTTVDMDNAKLCDEASIELNKLITIHDTFFCSDSAIKNELINEKNEEIKKIIEKIPEDTIDTNCHARITYILGKAKNCYDTYSKESEIYLRRSVKLNPKNVECWNTLGECCWKKHCYQDAKDCFLTAIDIQKNVDSFCHLSMLVKLMTTNSTANNSNTQAIADDSHVTHNENIVDLSLKYAKDAIQCDINSSKAWYVCGNAYMAKYFNNSIDILDLSKAINCYTRAEGLPNSNTNPDLYYNKAVLYQYILDFENTIKYFKIAKSIDPSFRHINDILINIENYIEYIKKYTIEQNLDYASGGVNTHHAHIHRILKKKEYKNYINEIQNSPFSKNTVGFDFLIPGAINEKRTLCVKILKVITISTNGNKKNDNSYIAMDKYGKYGIISIYHLGADISICDHHHSNNMIVTIQDPYVRGKIQNFSNKSSSHDNGDGMEINNDTISSYAHLYPEDGVCIVQVFDLNTILFNNKKINQNKISTSKLNVSTFV